ncbi:SDR family NAD(P)-dependent oxidoreductase [Mucilaginibacter rubeus]|uniref:SDR family NAD(P)-dependent oxidoreductase n=1 Tax=Mucilaginibacter rubeus TaxID=2027860 RepID=UPI0021D2D903|nr:SDR family NAD(P)-dependent oxidoreductase [Mucilaginibacter rubeus]
MDRIVYSFKTYPDQSGLSPYMIMSAKINLKEKAIVITGASSGAGRAAALAFAAEDLNLVLAARNEAALNEVKTECELLGAQAL